jgi:hypothetical protein
MAFGLAEAKIDVVTNSASVLIRDGEAQGAQATEVVANFPFTPDGTTPESKLRAQVLVKAKKVLSLVSEAVIS